MSALCVGCCWPALVVLKRETQQSQAYGKLATEEGRKACEYIHTMGLKVQETEDGKAQRVTIALRTMQYDITWFGGKLFVVRRNI